MWLQQTPTFVPINLARCSNKRLKPSFFCLYRFSEAYIDFGKDQLKFLCAWTYKFARIIKSHLNIKLLIFYYYIFQSQEWMALIILLQTSKSLNKFGGLHHTFTYLVLINLTKLIHFYALRTLDYLPKKSYPPTNFTSFYSPSESCWWVL